MHEGVDCALTTVAEIRVWIVVDGQCVSMDGSGHSAVSVAAAHSVCTGVVEVLACTAALLKFVLTVAF